MSRHRKLCRDIIGKLKRKMLVVTLSKSVEIESKKKPIEQVSTKNYSLRQKSATKTEDFAAIEKPIWAKNLRIHNIVLKCDPTLESL